MTKSKKVKKNKQTNLGPRVISIFFVFIMIYISAFVIMYMTKEKVDIHEVETGSINANNTYTGIAIRSEQIYYSDFAGNVNYFVGEGQRAAVGSVVYTIDETGRVASMIESLNAGENLMSENNKSTIRNTLSSYKTSRSDARFYEIYEIKDKLAQVVTDSVNENIVNNIDDMIKDTGSGDLFRFFRSDKTGIVVYNMDGYETLTVDQIKPEHFNKDNYSNTNLRSESVIVAQAPVFKLITDEMWQIAIPLTNDKIAEHGLADKKNVKIRFVKEDITTYANFEIVPTASGTYGILSLNKFMVQFASDRFIDVEIISSTSTGLKIPVSALVEKEFFTIPFEYATKGGDNKEVGFLVQHANDAGEIVTELYNPPIYAATDKFYYVDKEDFKYGDIIYKSQMDDSGKNAVAITTIPVTAPETSQEQPTQDLAETPVETPTSAANNDTSTTFVVSTVGNLKGVYVVNKGYAVFKKVEILEQNDEYVIAQKGVAYSISIYDHIVLDGTKVKENQIIY